MCPMQDDEGRNSDELPGFTNEVPGGASEDQSDESDILADQDLTEKMDLLSDDENLGAHSRSLDSLEDEPDDFMEGELDVKAAMDRAAEALDASIHGYQDRATEDSPRTELGAAFKDTPGGLEEVEMKTDQELAQRHHPLKGKTVEEFLRDKH
jgi:hypothetical protein